MAQSRREYEDSWQKNYILWNTIVGGKPLHQQIRLFMEEGDEEADKAIDAFIEENPNNKLIFRQVEAMIGQGSFFPGNHQDFEKLPQGLACTMCPAFSGVLDTNANMITVRCEWPDGIQTVQMRVDSTKVGGALEIRGSCQAQFGITK